MTLEQSTSSVGSYFGKSKSTEAGAVGSKNDSNVNKSKGQTKFDNIKGDANVVKQTIGICHNDPGNDA